MAAHWPWWGWVQWQSRAVHVIAVRHAQRLSLRRTHSEPFQPADSAHRCDDNVSRSKRGGEPVQKAAPRKTQLRYAGIGSAAHLNMQMLIAETGIDGSSHIRARAPARCHRDATGVAIRWAPLGAALSRSRAEAEGTAISAKTSSKLLTNVPTRRSWIFLRPSAMSGRMLARHGHPRTPSRPE